MSFTCPVNLAPNRCFLLLQVETVLDKESFTLEDLLDEDDLIQEVKSMNGRLVS